MKNLEQNHMGERDKRRTVAEPNRQGGGGGGGGALSPMPQTAIPSDYTVA